MADKVNPDMIADIDDCGFGDISENFASIQGEMEECAINGMGTGSQMMKFAGKLRSKAMHSIMELPGSNDLSEAKNFPPAAMIMGMSSLALLSAMGNVNMPVSGIAETLYDNVLEASDAMSEDVQIAMHS